MENNHDYIKIQRVQDLVIPPIRLVFNLGKKNYSVTAVRKSILKFVKLQSLVSKCVKIRKIYVCEVCKSCVYICVARQFANVVTLYYYFISIELSLFFSRHTNLYKISKLRN